MNARSLAISPFLAVLALAGCTTGNNNSAYAPAPWQQQPWQQQGYQQPPPGGFPLVHPMPAYNRPVNTLALRSTQVQTRPCAPQEVAPGVWAPFDCTFQRMTRVIPLVQLAMRSAGTSNGLVGGTSTGPLPASVDLRSFDGPIKNQGAVGACTAFSLSTAMDIAVRKMGHQDTLAPLHVWSEYAIPNMGLAGDQVVNDSITTEDRWPYDPAKACELTRAPGDSCGAAYGVSSGTGATNPELQAEKKAADASGRYKVSSVEEFDKPFNTDQMAAILAGGDPIWISMSVDPNAWKASNMQGGVISDYSVTGADGHAVVLVGYRPSGNGRQFLIHNSWGQSWGQGGYGWISDAMITRQTRAAYKVHVVDGSGTSPLPSIPGPANTGGCPSGQARDAVLGTCAPACASGSAPAAGVCLPSVPGFQLPFPNAQPQGGGSCQQGQGVDPMTRQCTSLCPNGTPPIGGLCIPLPAMH